MGKGKTPPNQLTNNDIPTVEAIATVRNRLLNTAIFAFAAVIFPGLAASLSRALDVGWKNVMLLHIGVFLLVLGTAIFRRRLSFYFRVYIILGILFISGSVGLLTWGLIGMGIFWLITCCILATIFLGIRSGQIILAGVFLVIAAIGIGVYLKRITFSFDINAYAVSASSWITAIVGTVFFTFVIVVTLGRLHSWLIDSVHILNNRTAELQQTNKQLQAENKERRRAEKALRESEKELGKHRHHLEELVETRTRELEIINKELEAFAYSVSHDLRAPLRHIAGFVQLLLKHEKEQLDQTSLRYFDNITDSTHKMERLIGDLLNLSRTGRAEMQIRRIELDELVRNVQTELAGESEGRHITWKVGPLPAVEGDATLLQQAWVNLLANAVKFTAPRTEARIEIGAVREEANQESEVTVFVRDNGVGFDPRYSHKLFGVFQRLHGEDEFEGTGIGLATVQRIIHRHGGRIRAEGKPDGGATFYFTLKAA